MKIRHFGIIAKEEKETVEFYKKLGFKIIKKTIEKWLNHDLSIVKMQNDDGQIIELIMGDWQPHIALTSDRTPNDLWEQFATKANQILTVKNKKDVFVIYLRDPSGNYVEIVHERGNNS